MEDRKENLSRRNFMARAGAGMASLLALSGGLPAGVQGAETTSGTLEGAAKAAAQKVPTRLFGKSKIPVSILSMGGMFDIPNNQLMLKKALDWGVSYWDTANGYEGGNSELGIGKFFAKFPEARKQVFLVTKSGKGDPKGLTTHLNLSLERMKTDHIDLFFLHGVGNMDAFTPEIKAWVEKAKAEGKIKLFGFSTHKNMAALLSGAATLGWIDGIMMTYNYRLMHDDDMKAGVEACFKAGIGLTAMKTQGGGPVKADSEADLKLGGRFLQKGFTPEQAKLKAVWENESVAAVCSQMPNLTILMANIAAAVDKTKLEVGDLEDLKSHDVATNSGYCAGCSHLCDGAMGGDCAIADVMRFRMYHESYGDVDRARRDFAELPINVRATMASRDYQAAERACPRGLAIGRLMREAVDMLG